jgi:hypothetical protein
MGGPRLRIALPLAAALLAAGDRGVAAPVESKVIKDIDLSAPFGTRTPWRLVATQGPPVADEPYPGESAPGSVRLCLKVGSGPCRVALKGLGSHPWTVADFNDPHFLNVASLVHPRGKAGAPLLLLRTSSLLSGDGDQFVFTQLFAYRPAADRFEQVYERETGHNNNQEVRFIAAGPLAGDVIAAQPTDHAPYGFWITVSQLTPAYTYRQVARFRSATRYNDGNPLAVIDSEMANIQAHLGVWRAGAPPPLPARPCPNPRLAHMELWCDASTPLPAQARRIASTLSSTSTRSPAVTPVARRTLSFSGSR